MIWVVGHPDLLAEVLAGFPALWFLAEPLTLSIAPVGEEGLFAVETNSFMVLVGHVASRQPRTNDEKESPSGPELKGGIGYSVCIDLPV